MVHLSFTLLLSDRADVHRLAAASRLDHGVEAFGGAEELLGLLHVALLLGLQSRLHVLLLSALQEFQLLKSCRKTKNSGRNDSSENLNSTSFFFLVAFLPNGWELSS